MTITDLKPELIWGIFHEITQVPRPSKKEEKIREYLLDFAKKHGIEAKTDAIGNVAMLSCKAIWTWFRTRPNRKHIILKLTRL